MGSPHLVDQTQRLLLTPHAKKSNSLQRLRIKKTRQSTCTCMYAQMCIYIYVHVTLAFLLRENSLKRIVICDSDRKYPQSRCKVPFFPYVNIHLSLSLSLSLAHEKQIISPWYSNLYLLLLSHSTCTLTQLTMLAHISKVVTWQDKPLHYHSHPIQVHTTKSPLAPILYGGFTITIAQWSLVYIPLLSYPPQIERYDLYMHITVLLSHLGTV